MRKLVLMAMLAGACGQVDEAHVARQTGALAASPLFGPEGAPLPACEEVDLGGVDAPTVVDLGDDHLILIVDGVAVCRGSEAEISDALGGGHVIPDPDPGTPLPSLTKDPDPSPPEGTPLPSVY